MTTGADPVQTFVEDFSVESYTPLQGRALDSFLMVEARRRYEWGTGRNAGRVPQLTEYGWRRGARGMARDPLVRDGYFLNLVELRGRIFRVMSVKLIRQWSTRGAAGPPRGRGASPVERAADPMLHPLSGEVVQALEEGRRITEIRKTVGIRNIEATKIKAAWELGALPAPVAAAIPMGQSAPTAGDVRSLKASLGQYARLRPDLDANQLRTLVASTNPRYGQGQREWLRGASHDAIHSRVGRGLNLDPDLSMHWNQHRRPGSDRMLTVYIGQAEIGEFSA